MVRFIHVSDTHLGARPYGLIERERDFYEAFRWVIDRAISLGVDAVLHAGDMFHSSTPRPVTYLAALRELRRLKDAGIRFIVAPGNHELPKAEGLGSPIKVPEDLGYAEAPRDMGEPYSVMLGDVEVLVFSEWASHKLGSCLPSRGRARVGLAHIALCDALEQAEGVPRSVCSGSRRITSDSIKCDYIYLAMGDIHTPWEHRIPGAPPIVYPGSTEYLDVDEYKRNNSRFAYLIELDDRSVTRIERLTIESVRPWILLEGGYDDVRRAVESIKRGQGKEPIVYVRVRGLMDQARRRALLSGLDSLKRDNVILYYRLVTGDGGVTRREYKPSPVTLESLVDSVFEKCGKDVRGGVASLLIELLENPSSDVASKTAKYLEDNEALLDCIIKVGGRL